MRRTVQDLQAKIEPKKKILTECNLKMKDWGPQKLNSPTEYKKWKTESSQ